MSNWEDWPHLFFGFFCDRYSAEAFVDSSWNPPDRQQIADYLDAPVNWIRPMSAEDGRCGLCGAPVGAAFGYDERWLWPVEVGHYVAEHQVRPPDAFVAHIRDRAYQMAEVERDLQDLPWPQADYFGDG